MISVVYAAVCIQALHCIACIMYMGQTREDTSYTMEGHIGPRDGQSKTQINISMRNI